MSAVAGSPFYVTSSGTSLNAPGSAQRADQVEENVEIHGGAGRGQSYFDPFAYRAVTEARFGTAGFNSLRGPAIFNLDMGKPGTNVSNLQLNPDGSVRSLGGYTEITSLANTGRDGIDERVFRFGLRMSW
jgi:hypothetical protein